MHHIGEVKEIKEASKGTYLKVFIPGTYLETKIERYKQNNKAYISIRLDDNRRITSLQRKKYYATLRDISEHTGYLEEDMHSYFKMIYRHIQEDVDISMSNCTVLQAKEMITILIAFIMTNDIPLTDLAINRVEDVDKYLYGCLVNRRCCICGQKAEIHHVVGSKIGMGNDRTKVDHVGRSAIALCRVHHVTTENGIEKEYLDKHKVYALKLDEHAVKKLKL